MSTVVIMPGGFHPFHAGHLALYQSAQRAFPDAEVYVAATNDTSERPFPFAVKEKLARLAGVSPNNFYQVKSPFRAEEITSKYNPEKDVVIFVRSEKDEGKPPVPGGVKKDGTPQKLQPLLGATKLEPFGQRVYMAYLPTVEFGPGMTSATEIRKAWPTLNDRRKTALVMSLYPRTQTDSRLAANIVKLLDTAMAVPNDSMSEDNLNYLSVPLGSAQQNLKVAKVATDNFIKLSDPSAYPGSKKTATGMAENQGWAATFTSEDYIEEKWSKKYKDSINCANPRGFSQRAHCAGRKK